METKFTRERPKDGIHPHEDIRANDTENELLMYKRLFLFFFVLQAVLLAAGLIFD